MVCPKALAVALVATTVLGGSAFAAEQAAQPGMTHETPAQNAIDKNAGKLSKEGAQAFRDMQLARLAIFEADSARAKSFIGKAQTALTKAKTDETAFNKSEADLKTPADMAASKSASSTADKASQAKADTKPASKEQVAWVPVDAQLSLGEDFVATPEKASAVAEANKSLAKGDKQGALDRLKLAHVDVNFLMAVLPLEKTTTDVDQAAALIDQGKYYEANALLKTAEDRMRFDVIDAVALPQKATAHATDKVGPQTTGTAQDAKTAK